MISTNTEKNEINNIYSQISGYYTNEISNYFINMSLVLPELNSISEPKIINQQSEFDFISF
jgi:hypothetical protein